MAQQNIDPVLWGPSAWSLLHAISFHSSSSMDTIRELFEDLKILLPCTKCQASYTHHLEMLPFPSRRESLFKWVYELHHRINASLQTPSMIDTPPYPTVQKLWRGTSGIEKGKRESWRFLFFLAMMFPSIKNKTNSIDTKRNYQKALSDWLHEITKTLWNQHPPQNSDLNSRTAFIKWLSQQYRLQHENNAPPSYYLKRLSTKCSKTCKL
jgi:hypothetical protein